MLSSAKQLVILGVNLALNKERDVLIDSLEGVKNRFFELAYATMHTTGQSFMMSFQASGPHGT